MSCQMGIFIPWKKHEKHIMFFLGFTYLWDLYTIYIPFIYHLYTIYIPFIYHLYTIYIPFIYHLYTIYIPFIYHLYTMSYCNNGVSRKVEHVEEP